MSRLPRFLFQDLEDRTVLLHLPVKPLVMPLITHVEGDLLGAFLLHDRHAGEPMVSHIEGDALGDVGVVPGPGGKDDGVVLDTMCLVPGDVDQAHAGEICENGSLLVKALAGGGLAEELQKFRLAVAFALISFGRQGEHVRHGLGHPPFHAFEAVRQDVDRTLDRRSGDEKPPHLHADAAGGVERVEPEQGPAVAETDHVGGKIERGPDGLHGCGECRG